MSLLRPPESRQSRTPQRRFSTSASTSRPPGSCSRLSSTARFRTRGKSATFPTPLASPVRFLDREIGDDFRFFGMVRETAQRRIVRVATASQPRRRSPPSKRLPAWLFQHCAIVAEQIRRAHEPWILAVAKIHVQIPDLHRAVLARQQAQLARGGASKYHVPRKMPRRPPCSTSYSV